METVSSDDNKMSVRGIIWNVSNGEIKEIKIDNVVFIKKLSIEDKSIIKEQQKPPTQEEEPEEITVQEEPEEITVQEETVQFVKEEPSQVSTGKRLERLPNTSIYVNILDEVKEAIKEKKNQSELKKIIRNYHPNVLEQSIMTYLSGYKKYIRSKYPELAELIPKRKKLGKKKLDVTPTFYDSKKGERIARLGHNSVFENILNDIKNAYKNNSTESDLVDVIREYYPDTPKIASLRTYLSLYKRYLVNVGFLKKTISGIQLDEEYEEEFEKKYIEKMNRSYPEELKKKRIKRRKKPGAIGFDKRYGTWILQDEVDQIKRAINTVEYGYKPTSQNIKKKCSTLVIQRIRAVLHWMADQKMITWYYEDGNGPIYKMS